MKRLFIILISVVIVSLFCSHVEAAAGQACGQIGVVQFHTDHANFGIVGMTVIPWTTIEMGKIALSIKLGGQNSCMVWDDNGMVTFVSAG